MSLPSKKGLALVWALPTALACLLTYFVSGHFTMREAEPSSTAFRDSLVGCLRASLEDLGSETWGTMPNLSSQDRVVVRLYLAGALYARLSLVPGPLSSLCKQGHLQLAALVKLRKLSLYPRRSIAIVIDEVSARGPILSKPSMLAALTLHPSLDGLGVRVGEEEFVLLPSELVDANLLSSNRPIGAVPDFVFGFDRKRADLRLQQMSGSSAEKWAQLEKEYFRFRSHSYLEDPARLGKAGQGLIHGSPPTPALGEASLREAAILGGHYLVKHMAENGRYIYTANLATGAHSNPKMGAYSLPRHAGTTYFLAELYRITNESFLKEPIERAIGHLADLVVGAGCKGVTPDGKKFACVSDKGRLTSDLGSTALAVVALAEYRRATNSTRFDPLMKALAEFLLFMQRPDGSFYHRYDWKKGEILEDVELLYYSGEASFALARMYVVTEEPRYLKATESGLDWLVGWYDFFLGGFFYGEEHWTCIAAEAISEALYKPQYWEFCSGYGKFLRRHQQELGDFQDQAPWSGAYYFSPFLVPQNTPAGSRTEAMISTYLLGQRGGHQSPEIYRQIMSAMQFSLSQQVRKDSLYRVSLQAEGLGGIPGSPIDRLVRIDYVQHVGSAMIRAAELLRKEELGKDGD